MLFDTHAHLDQEEFNKDLLEVISRAAQAGVTQLITIGTTVASSRAAVEIAEANEHISAAVGIQPNYCAEAELSDWESIVSLAEHPKIVAIGETGLDRHWDYTPLVLQQDYFDRHIRLARKKGLPFIVHMRDCDADILEALRAAHQREGALRGVMHSFTGSVEMAAECMELGMHISFAGMVTFKKSHELRSVAEVIPNDRLLIETDSPYLSPDPLRGRRNEPSHLVHTAKCLAEVRGVSLEQLATTTTANARALFKIDDDIPE